MTLHDDIDQAIADRQAAIRALIYTDVHDAILANAAEVRALLPAEPAPPAPPAPPDPPQSEGLAIWPAIAAAEVEQWLPGYQLPTPPIGTATSASLSHMGVSDLTIHLPPGPSGPVNLTNCQRILVSGHHDGTSSIASATVFGSSDVIIEGIAIRGGGSSIPIYVQRAPWVPGAPEARRVAFINCVAAPMQGTASNAALILGEDVGLFGCNLAALDNGGVNDWPVRFSGTNRALMVDCQLEGRSSQPIVRRTLGNGDSTMFCKRVTTIHQTRREAFSDVPSSSHSGVFGRAVLRNCTSYLGGSGALRFGGVNSPTSGDFSGDYLAADHVYHRATLAELQALAAGAPSGAAWDYTTGATFGAATWQHPGWPSRGLVQSNPYLL